MAPSRTSARRGPVVIAVVLVVAAVGAGLWWFQPHKLFLDERVSDTIPVVPGSSGGSTSTTEPAPGGGPTTTEAPVPATEPVVLATGDFISRDHTTSGVVRVLELADGSRLVRLEGLDTDNGPDLYLYLTTTPSGGDEGAFDDDFVDLGRLKGNQGDQNYELGTDVELDRFSSVVIWCDRFDSAFGAADLVLAG